MLFDCNGSIKEPNTYTIYMRKNGSVKCYEEEMSSSFSFTGMKKKNLKSFLESCGIVCHVVFFVQEDDLLIL